jgi:putative intracellular protease/amidase
MDAGRAHFALYDTLNDPEAGLLLVELRTGRFTGASFDVVTVAESREPMTGYAGGHRYVDDRAVIDGDLITAGPQSPVQFARATLQRLGLASERTLEAYEGFFDRGDSAAFPVLMESSAAA